MKLYFGKISPEHRDEVKSLYEHNGNYYYFCVETDEDNFEDVRIKDTCGRYVPIDVTHIGALINILSYIRDYAATERFRTYFVDSAMNKLARFYSLDS